MHDTVAESVFPISEIHSDFASDVGEQFPTSKFTQRCRTFRCRKPISDIGEQFPHSEFIFRYREKVPMSGTGFRTRISFCGIGTGLRYWRMNFELGIQSTL